MIGIKRIGSETWARVPYLVDHRLPAVCCSCHPEACLSSTWTSWRVGCSTREITHFQGNLRASTTFDPWSLSISTGNPHETVATFVEKDTRYDRSLYPKWQIVWSKSLLTKFLKISIQFLGDSTTYCRLTLLLHAICFLDDTYRRRVLLFYVIIHG